MSTNYEKLELGRRIALWSVAASGVLAVANIGMGIFSGSTSVIAIGAEFAGDVLASAAVIAGMTIAARPPDADHPYGHGRFETLAGLIVGMILAAGGVGICWRSLQRVTEIHDPPPIFAAWPLVGAMVVRGTMFAVKFRIGRRIRSAALMADAWNDAVDILSAAAALVALTLTIRNPTQFLAADHYGGFVVGVVVVFTGIRIIRDASLDLADTAPDPRSLEEIRALAMTVPGVRGVEKCLARKSGLQYFVDLHLEVDPQLTVRESHEIAGLTRTLLRARLDWVADVLVHIEPVAS